MGYVSSGEDLQKTSALLGSNTPFITSHCMSVYGVNGDGNKDVSNSILMETANLFVIYFSRFSITSARDSLLNVVSGNCICRPLIVGKCVQFFTETCFIITSAETISQHCMHFELVYLFLASSVHIIQMFLSYR
jgi:hypothetical protein